MRISGVNMIGGYKIEPPPPPPPASLYDFTSFTFTTGNTFGRFGPNLDVLKLEYDELANPWVNNTSYFSVTEGIQLWTIPEDGVYTIEARGAQGGNPTLTTGGYGAIMRGDFELTKGERIQILVGQTAPQTIAPRLDKSSVGGGGTFVIRTNQPNYTANILVIAGGGGGTGSSRGSAFANANVLLSGNPGKFSNPGGTAGSGGTSTPSNGGGGGYLANSSPTTTGIGFAFIHGGAGGVVNPSYSLLGGGFGGGGSATNGLLFRYSGGGGYSGGGASSSIGNTDGTGDTSNHWGGGGGSYNAGTNQNNTVGNSGSGSVYIAKII